MRLQKFILAVLVTVAAPSTWADSFPFEKQAPYAKIQELFGKSREEKIRLIQASGVVVRIVEFKNPRMLGQYLDLAHYPGLAVPEIRLAARADDWTIVHEYIHALFAEHGRHQELVPLDQFQQAESEYAEAWSAYKTSWRYQSTAHQEKAVRSFATIMRYQLSQLSNFELEEIAIESYLREVYLKQKPAEFSEEGLEMSTAYIKMSGTAALGAFKKMNLMCADMTASFERERLSVPAVVGGLCTLSRIYHSQLKDILQKAQIRVYEPIGDK